MAIRVNGTVMVRDPVTGRLSPAAGTATTRKKATQAAAKQAGRTLKTTGAGIAASLFSPGGLIGGAGLGGSPFGPGPGGGSPFGPGPGGGGPGGGGLGGLCSLLSGTARKLCEAGSSLFGGPSGGGGGGGAGSCKPGQIEIAGRCFGLGAIGGRAGNGGNGGNGVPKEFGAAVMGAFNMPALEPAVEERLHRTCPEGMVLGKDNLCYPKAILSRRSRFRKWRQPRRPLFTAGDLNAIRRAERLKAKAKKIGKDLGFKVTNR